MSSRLASLTAALERQLTSVVPKLPESVVRRLAGAPLVIDGRTLDPLIQLAAAAATRKPAIHTLPVAHARRGANASLANGNADRPTTVVVADQSVSDHGLTVRTYRRAHTTAAARPAMLFMHQGGYVIGDLDSCDSFCARVASELDVVVVSLDYRLAPEHKFPAQIDDALVAWDWMQASANSLDLDPNRVIVAGDSAGGHLSALLSQRLRDRETTPPIMQVLVYPFVDALAEGGSLESCADSFPLSTATMTWFSDHYLPDGFDVSDPAFNSAGAVLTGLPPAIVVTAGFDPLCDQGIAYAESLSAAGNDVVARCENALSHSFLSMDGAVPEAAAARDRLIADIASVLG